MARKPRHIIPGVPHHITQRGNRRQTVFFTAEDYHAYKRMLADACLNYKVDIWAYCLMPNHVHIIAVPCQALGLTNALAETSWRYARRINARHGWTGNLWQGRFRSHAMDERHLLMAARYVELNPVRANLCKAPEDYLWSSADAHLRGCDDDLVTVAPMLGRVSDWREYLSSSNSVSESELIRAHSKLTTPLADSKAIKCWEQKFGLDLTAKKRGKKSKAQKLEKVVWDDLS